MPSITLTEIDLPDFGVPETRPELGRAIYARRLDSLRKRMAAAGLDTLVLYADREHTANMAWLTDFDPRFEESLLILTGNRTPVIATGAENLGRAAATKIDTETILYPPFGLLGQDRTKTPALADVLTAAGVAHGQTIGVAGWKYFGAAESATADTWLDAPSYVADTIRALAGPNGRVVNAAALLMHPSEGLRSVNEVDQIAQFEFSACQTSEAVKRVLFGVRPGMRESEAALLFGQTGLPQNCHPMLTAGPRAYFGVESPGDRVIQRGDPFTKAYGVIGALTARAGWMVADASELPPGIADYVEKLAAPYFACAAEWYETVGIGVTGGEIDAMVKRHLGGDFFRLALNPGHLIHIEEWMNTPIYPGSNERLQSGQAIQCDIIPATGGPYFTTNIEDGIALLDEPGRDEMREKHPGIWGRISARRAFMADVLGIRLKPETLPLSNLNGYLPPFILAPRRALVRRDA